MKKILFFASCFVMPIFIYSQFPAFDWAKQMKGNYTAEGRSIAVDAYGNVYTTGSFYGTVDFNPGVGTFNLTSPNNNSDIFISKVDSKGNFIWAKRIGGILRDAGFSIALDSIGNVYITGIFQSNVDFDPGSSIVNIGSTGGTDIFILKLDISGNFVWAKGIGGDSDDEGYAIKVDMLGNVYITGRYNDTADFNPGNGIFNLISNGNYDIFISKFNSTGNFLWAKSIGGTIQDYSYSIALDISCNIYTTGTYSGSVDFDPGLSIFNLTSSGIGDKFISKLDSSGNFEWAKSMGNGVGFSLVLDTFRNIYITGVFSRTADFDPDTGIFKLTPANADIFIAKFTSSGNFIWAKIMGGNQHDRGYSIAVDLSSNVYTTGFFQGSADFDPGTGVHNLTSADTTDVFISVLDSSGNFLWARNLGMNSDYPNFYYVLDNAYSIALDTAGYIYTTGCFAYTVDFDLGTGKSYLTATGQKDIFVLKMSGRKILTPAINITSSIIPPWQRKNDPYDGSVIVTTQYPQKASWHLQIQTYYNNKAIDTINYKSTTDTIQKFSSNDSLLDAIDDLNGLDLRYFAVLDSNNTIAQIDPDLNNPIGNSNTRIIEQRWVNKNLVYYNDYSNNDKIQIPVKWEKGNKPIKVVIKRVEYTARKSVLGYDVGIAEADNLINNTIGTNEFPISQDGICQISASNSNIEATNLFPGDFEFTIFYNSGIETGYFDLTKIGIINKGNSNKILVMIGGIYNEMESSARYLSTDSYVYPPSDIKNPINKDNSSRSYSVIEHCRAYCISDFSSWYIAQGNANSIIRNGYDIGIALQSIIRLNPKIDEINLLCHSKGGLDTRALLAGYNISMAGKRFNYNDSSISNYIKKVVFFDTPHYGAKFAADALFYIPSKVVLNTPAALDLIPDNATISALNNISMPNNIHFLNLTGYNEFNKKYNKLSDDIVLVSESEMPSLKTSNLYQLYQHNPLNDCSPKSNCSSFPNSHFFHFDIHKNSILNYPGNSKYKQTNCTNIRTNLEKIRVFLDDPNPSSSTYNCESYTFQYNVTLYGSKVSGAELFIKSNGFTYPLNRTEENGKICFNSRFSLNSTDSLIILANGYESMTIPFNNNKMDIVLMSNNSLKIVNPNINLTNQNPITNSSKIDIKLSGINTTNYEVCIPANQDSIFKPLSLVNDKATISLDTGYNRILIKFIGKIDTIILAKEIYFFPDTFKSKYTENILINSNNMFLGTKLYVDNEFYKDIITNQTSIAVLKGSRNYKFSLFGYKDTTYTLDSIGIINLYMEPISYSSNDDSIKYDYSLDRPLNYWKNITTKKLDTTTSKAISIKQFDNSFRGTGLNQLSRTFQFRNISSARNPILKAAMCLDQALPIPKDIVYLLISNGNKQFKKVDFSDTGLYNYDSIVQKLSCNKIDFDSGRAKLEQITIMKRLAPIGITKTFIVNPADSIIVDLRSLFIDPDSITDDMTFSFLNFNTNFSMKINGENLVIIVSKDAIGNNSFYVKATHDGYTVSNEVFVNINPINDIKVCPNPKSEFKVFPTPNNGVFNIIGTFTTENINIEIYNNLGVLVYTQSCLERTNIFDLRNQPNGLYVIKLLSENNIIGLQKIIKE